MAAPSSVDICWIAHTTGVPFQEDLLTLRDLSAQSSSSFALALAGKPNGSLPQFTENVDVIEMGEPGFCWDLTKAPDPLSDEAMAKFISIVERWQVDATEAQEANLLQELIHLIIDCGPSFRPNLLWHQPEVIRAMMACHEKRQFGVSVTDMILIANELMEVLIKTARMVDSLPLARVYHGVRGTYCGFIACIAAERNDATLVYSDSLGHSDDMAPFWLKALPHHWHGSLSHSRIYQMAGRHALRLARQLVMERAERILVPFMNREIHGPDSEKVTMLAPGLTTERTLAKPRVEQAERLTAGWLMTTINLEALDRLAEVVEPLPEFSEAFSIRIIEAAPHQRNWVCDMEQWLTKHPRTAAILNGVVPYQLAEIEALDVLVHLPMGTDTELEQESGEQAAWVVLQGLSVGVPIIGTTSLKSFLNSGSGEVGICVPADEPAKAGDAIRRFVAEPKLRELLSRTALEATGTIFSRTQAAATQQAVYDEILSQPVNRLARLTKSPSTAPAEA